MGGVTDCFVFQALPRLTTVYLYDLDNYMTPCQPRSQGSLLPALPSRSVGRVGENPGNEVDSLYVLSCSFQRDSTHLYDGYDDAK